jgi:hypothetical protein
MKHGYKDHDHMATVIAYSPETGEGTMSREPLDENICGPECHNLTNGTAQKGNPEAFRAGWERTFGTKHTSQVS